MTMRRFFGSAPVEWRVDLQAIHSPQIYKIPWGPCEMNPFRGERRMYNHAAFFRLQTLTLETLRWFPGPIL